MQINLRSVRYFSKISVTFRLDFFFFISGIVILLFYFRKFTVMYKIINYNILLDTQMYMYCTFYSYIILFSNRVTRKFLFALPTDKAVVMAIRHKF